MIGTEDKAKSHAKTLLTKSEYENSETLVVGEHGDIHANCNVDEICTQHESSNEKYFILVHDSIAMYYFLDRFEQDVHIKKK